MESQLLIVSPARLRYMVDNVTTLALAWFFTDEDKYAKRAVQLVDVWFLDPKTAMYPNLDYSQVASGPQHTQTSILAVLLSANLNNSLFCCE